MKQYLKPFFEYKAIICKGLKTCYLLKTLAATKISLELLQELLPTGQLVSQHKGATLCTIHKKVKHLYWLIEGSLDFYTQHQNAEQEVQVAHSDTVFTTIGWNGFFAPERYTFSAKIASGQATFYKVPITDFKADLAEVNTLLLAVCQTNYQLLKNALSKQASLLRPQSFQIPKDEHFYLNPSIEKSEIIHLMRRSPFLDQFSEPQLNKLAKLVQRRDYEPSEIIYAQDSASEGLYILIHGEVAIKRMEGKIDISQRSISNSGFIFGWSSLLNLPDICNAITTEKTAVYFINHLDLHQLLEEDDRLKKRFYHRLIWLIGNQINAAFIRYTSLLGKHSIDAVYQLIENNRSRLTVNSGLHSVFHLLKDQTTKALAYETLQNLVTQGSSLERHIASLSLEFLKHDRREHQFKNALRSIYEAVAENNPETSPQHKRKACAQATREALKQVMVHVEGLENLPEDSGHIFIYNHLLNHPFYTLNNQFQITLDSHFISVLLDDKYGEPGIRTVRIAQGQEYGHQNYYENLGYINVYTKESELPEAAAKTSNRSIFYTAASEFLKNKKNLIISPEGTSYTSEESPGAFKTGAFNLALNLKTEPLIVPIVLVNFDKRINDTLFYCNILKPFKMSDHVDKNDPALVKAFVEDYQKKYADYVAEAREKVKRLMTSNFSAVPEEEPPVMWANEIKRLRRRVEKLKNQEDLYVFYGSSSVRLWVHMQEDLAPMHTLNLGFGGSTYAWCLHYFEEIFQDVNPSKLILYAGENDITQGRTPLEVLADFKELTKAVKAKYPKVPLAVISLKPSVERAHLIPQFMELNELLSEYVITGLDAQFINVFSQMISLDDKPNPELYMSDGLHLNKKGYAIWSEVIKQALQKPV